MDEALDNYGVREAFDKARLEDSSVGMYHDNV